MGVARAISAGTGRGNSRYAVNSRETFDRRFVTLLNVDAVPVSSAFPFISWLIAVSFVSLSSVIFFCSRTEISCAMD